MVCAISSTAIRSTTLFTLSSKSSSSSSYNSLSFAKPNTFFIPKLNVTNSNNTNTALCATTKPYLSKSSVADKLNNLASEFTSLSEPIDRVKRLLHYASLLPPLRDGERVAANRVAGCATEVWVVAEIDERRRMRFRGDSDSEISKGFCSCLVFMLDGAKPEEVLALHNHHLADINVAFGINLKAHSRINTWHNVFFTMQNSAKLFLTTPYLTSRELLILGKATYGESGEEDELGETRHSKYQFSHSSITPNKPHDQLG